jgi:hypothetical protein
MLKELELSELTESFTHVAATSKISVNEQL